MRKFDYQSECHCSKTGEVFGIIKSEIPSVTDYRVIESIALERITERNGEMKWFRMRKVRSS